MTNPENEFSKVDMWMAAARGRLDAGIEAQSRELKERALRHALEELERAQEELENE